MSKENAQKWLDASTIPGVVLEIRENGELWFIPFDSISPYI